MKEKEAIPFEVNFENHLKVYTSHCVSYSKYIGSVIRNPLPRLDSERKHKKTLSIQSERKINKIIDFMADSAKWKKVYCKEQKKHFNFKLGFITLTLSHSQLSKVGKLCNNLLCAQMLSQKAFDKINNKFILSDNEIKDVCLNQFLTELRQKHNVVNYLWKAETQENGNIHFHIIIDQFIWHGRLRDIWNRIQNKLGIIDEFEKRYHHRDPNSIDVHSVRKIKNLKKYFSKYLSKSDERRRSVDGRVWGCNYQLSRYNGTDVIIDYNTFGDEFQNLLQSYPIKIHYMNYSAYYHLSLGQIAYTGCCPRLVIEITKQFEEKYDMILSWKE
jgi:hypothetical protein